MPEREGYFAFIRPMRRRGRPDQGLPGEPDYPDQGLPGVDDGGEVDQGFNPDYPAHLPGRPGRPSRPEYPSQRPPWEKPSWPPGPTDPGWGVDGDGGLSPQPPIYLPIGPDQGLPDHPHYPAHPLPDPPPGTIWPPLPPSAPAGKAALLCFISGVGFRYIVVDIPERGPPARPQPEPGEPEVDPTRRR